MLALKVCDPAMGSGTFLVEACQQLAARLIEAWRVHESERPTLPPDEDEELHAHRLVAQRCLYGVDRNPMATDLARLSLWLATLARDHEFTFLNHSLGTGDSLVGLTRGQIERLNTRDDAQGTLFGGIVGSRVAAALAARREIREAHDDVALHEQERRHAVAEAHMAELRLVGDAVVAAHFGDGKDKARRAALERLHEAASSTDRIWPALRAAAAELQGGEHPLRPFHWELEFPEVFAGEAPGFDAIVGNPPFAGKNTLINGHRDGYLDWLQAVHAGAHGNADLVSHFVRRAFGLLRPGGCFGLIATNTVGQGDTRESGLRAVLEAGGSVLRAVRRLPWPGEAAVVVSVVHVRKGGVRSPVLDERQVRRVSAYLVEGDLDASPARLAANAGKAFIGCFLLGMGFTFDDVAVTKGKPASTEAERLRLIAKDPRNAERIFPYLGGEEVNTDPRHAHRRWCIDFNDFPLRRVLMPTRWAAMGEREQAECRRTGLVPEDYPDPVAADWPDLLEIVERLVKPERLLDKRDARRRRWWLFAKNTPALRRAIFGFKQVNVLSRVSARFGIATVPTGIVCAETVVVFADQGAALRAVLQSRVHEVWAAFFASSLEDRLRYGPSDCFDTFPFPPGYETNATIIGVGQEYHDHRAAVMAEHGQGLTKTYNRFHKLDERKPGIVGLRDLHQAMDQAVLIAYGWDDLAAQAAPMFLDEDTEAEHRYKKRLFWPAPFRDEVLARLLALNVERAADERRRGLAPAPAEADDLGEELDDADELEDA